MIELSDHFYAKYVPATDGPINIPTASISGANCLNLLFGVKIGPASVAIRNSRKRKGPTYAKRGIVVPDASGSGRCMEDRHHIAHAGRRLEGLESMGEAGRNV